MGAGDLPHGGKTAGQPLCRRIRLADLFRSGPEQLRIIFCSEIVERGQIRFVKLFVKPDFPFVMLRHVTDILPVQIGSRPDFSADIQTGADKSRFHRPARRSSEQSFQFDSVSAAKVQCLIGFLKVPWGIRLRPQFTPLNVVTQCFDSGPGCQNDFPLFFRFGAAPPMGVNAEQKSGSNSPGRAGRGQRRQIKFSGAFPALPVRQLIANPPPAPGGQGTEDEAALVSRSKFKGAGTLKFFSVKIFELTERATVDGTIPDHFE